MYNPEMILSNLWSFVEYQGKKDNDPSTNGTIYMLCMAGD
jgi:hypothetical protein